MFSAVGFSGMGQAELQGWGKRQKGAVKEGGRGIR